VLISQRVLSLGLAAMRRLNSAWSRLTLRKVIVVGIAVMTVVAALKNAFGVVAILVLPCAMLLLLIWGLSRLFGLLGLSKWSENIRVALALAVVVGLFLFCGFMLSTPKPRVFRHAELNAKMQAKMQAEMQEVRIERNQLRIGMTIDDVLPLLHGSVNIDAMPDDAWLLVLPDNKRFLYSPDSPSLRQHDDGTFTFWCTCRTEPVSRNAKLTESQVVELLIKEKPKQVVENLTAPQAAELMKQKMSGGYEWHCTFTFDKRLMPPTFIATFGFTVTFGPDGRVKDISDVHTHDHSSSSRA
jgi:hypothetical protein